MTSVRIYYREDTTTQADLSSYLEKGNDEDEINNPEKENTAEEKEGSLSSLLSSGEDREENAAEEREGSGQEKEGSAGDGGECDGCKCECGEEEEEGCVECVGCIVCD